MKKITTAEQAVDFLAEKIVDLNEGGCLVGAYSLYLFLKKNNLLTDDFRIVELSQNPYDVSVGHNKNFLKGRNKTATSDSHFAWSWNGGKTVVDAFGATHHCDYKLIIPQEKTDEFCISALNFGGWNYDFNRALSVPKIAKAFGIDLSKVNLKKAEDDCGGTYRS